MNHERQWQYESIEEAAQAVRAIDGRTPDIGVVLGSGLSAFADTVDEAVRIPYERIPHFPVPTVSGRLGVLFIGRVGGRTVVVMKGRVHYYEGYPIRQVVFPARVMAALGVKAVIVTNAAGGVNAGFVPGDLMLIEDHLNLMGVNPLLGENDERLGRRFPDMTFVYPADKRRAVLAAAEKLDIPLRRGVYAALSGPAYETPAEVRMLQRLGADAVGMSTVPEATALAHSRVPVVGLSCITNYGAGLTDDPLTDEEVMVVAARTAPVFIRLLQTVVETLPL